MTLMVPPIIHPAVRSRAERRVFGLIRDADDSGKWICLHSLGLSRHPTKRRGEADFILIADKCVLVIEVKGGRVSRRGGEWTTTDRYGDPATLRESPFEQASSAMFALDRALGEAFPGEPVGRPVLGYGVMFPDVEFDRTGTDGHPELVFDTRDIDLPTRAFVERLERFAMAASGPSRHVIDDAGRKRLLDFLRGDFDLVPGLSNVADGTLEEIHSLTEDQYRVLDVISTRERVIIEGGAGTGKTMIAAEAARRESTAGRKVLFLCFNRNLAGSLASRLSGYLGSGNLVVDTVHGFLTGVGKRSVNRDRIVDDEDEEGRNRLFWEEIPAAARKAAPDHPLRSSFDTLLLDEAQDVLVPSVVDALEPWLKDGWQSGHWLLFLDSNNQASLFGRFDPATYRRFTTMGSNHVLVTNCRNTRQIAGESEMLAAPMLRSAARVDGPPVEYVWYSDPGDQVARLRATLGKLAREGVAPGRIAIISPRSPGNSCVSGIPGKELDAIAASSGKGGTFLVSTVQSFKGLESDVVVMTDVERIDGNWWRAALYVGMTRARAALVILVSGSCRRSYEERVRGSLPALPDTRTPGSTDGRRGQ